MTALADATAAAMLTTWASLDDELIDDEDFDGLATGILLRANARATMLADLALAAWLTLNYGRIVPTLGLGLADTEAGRLALAVGTLRTAAKDRPDPAASVERLGRSEPLRTAQETYVRGIARRGLTGYIRGLSAHACELCHWLERDGYVWPADKPFHQHPGCTCIPIPVGETA